MVLLAKAVGRRKEAVAQVQIKLGTGLFVINNKPVQEYLQNDFYSLLSVKAPFDALSTTKQTRVASPGEQITNGQQLPDVVHTFQEEQKLILDTIVIVKGGGLMGQTEAIRLGISRAICLLATNKQTSTQAANNLLGDVTLPESETLPNLNALDIRKQLKDKGYLTQDSRVKERRKYGLKKARKASQYHKR